MRRHFNFNFFGNCTILFLFLNLFLILMDIELFNKQLAIKVAKATNLEKRGEIKNAIDAWLEVSEMSLKFSKTRGIDSTFRNMLIKRTEKIVDHIKSLKLNLAEPERIVKSDLFNDREFLSQDFDDTIEDTEIPDNLKKESANTKTTKTR